MLKWVREGKIDVYCECVIEKDSDNINEVVESDGRRVEMNGEYSVLVEVMMRKMGTYCN